MCIHIWVCFSGFVILTSWRGMIKKITFFMFILVHRSLSAKTCVGTRMDWNMTETPSDRLELLKQLHGCSTVWGNLELASLPEKSDLTFLQSIEVVTGYIVIYKLDALKIPLPKLFLIKGFELFNHTLLGPSVQGDNRVMYSLVMAHNTNMEMLGLNSLTEITRGHVLSTGNNQLCFDVTVSWEDVQKFQNDIFRRFEGAASWKCSCHVSCLLWEDSRHCFGPNRDDCHRLTKIMCRESCMGERCFAVKSVDENCCWDTCAGGCIGYSENDCKECLFYRSESQCPELHGCPYGIWYTYGYSCVFQCPGGTLIQGHECVHHCSKGFALVGNVCTPCQGHDTCEIVCPGTGNGHLTSTNIKQFERCVIVNGSIHISENGFKTRPLSLKDLELLKNVKVIRGSLLIDFKTDTITNLSFFENLKTIEGKYDAKGFLGLKVHNTSLENLGFSKLERISNGFVSIVGNENLCFLDKNHIRTLGKSIRVDGNKSGQECANEKKACHPTCSGCRGTTAADCFMCRHYKVGDKCGICHTLCSRCYGGSSSECIVCRHYTFFPFDKTSFTCLKTCDDFEIEPVNGHPVRVCKDENLANLSNSGISSLWHEFNILAILLSIYY